MRKRWFIYNEDGQSAMIWNENFNFLSFEKLENKLYIWWGMLRQTALQAISCTFLRNHRY
jgi:hypothetical protein